MDFVYNLLVSVYQLIALLPAPSDTVGPPTASTQFAPSRGGVTGRVVTLHDRLVCLLPLPLQGSQFRPSSPDLLAKCPIGVGRLPSYDWSARRTLGLVL